MINERDSTDIHAGIQRSRRQFVLHAWSGSRIRLLLPSRKVRLCRAHGKTTQTECTFLLRGRAMGLFTVCLTNSANVAYIPGGVRVLHRLSTNS